MLRWQTASERMYADKLTRGVENPENPEEDKTALEEAIRLFSHRMTTEARALSVAYCANLMHAPLPCSLCVVPRLSIGQPCMKSRPTVSSSERRVMCLETISGALHHHGSAPCTNLPRSSAMLWLTELGSVLHCWQYTILPNLRDKAKAVSRTFRRREDVMENAFAQAENGWAAVRRASGYLLELHLPHEDAQSMLHNLSATKWGDQSLSDELDDALGLETQRVRHCTSSMASRLMHLARALDMDVKKVSLKKSRRTK